MEKETPALLAPNVTLQARADCVVRRRRDGLIFVFNWKSSSRKEGWTSQWEDDVQAWTEALATEEALGEKVAGVVFEGFYKGQLRDGMWTSPLLYGWKIPTAGGGFAYSATYERFTKEKPWRKFSTWNESFPFGKGLAAWISWIPERVVSEQFLRTPPILKHDDVVQDWITQVVRRETDIEHILESGSPEDIAAFFWQNFKGWNCEKCIFRKACKRLASLEELVEEGLLVRREDHHGPSK